jgi:two-component system OmpR family response regulator
MSNPAHILVVDDELELLQAIQEYLCMRGFRVSTARNGKEMKDILSLEPVDLVLLDLGLPGENGIDLTRKLKSTSNPGIIIVTAHGDSEDRVLGLESGADDYIVKPFNFRELLARVNSVMRRTRNTENRSTDNPNANKIQIGDWVFEYATGSMTKADGTKAELSTGELDLLVALIANANKPTTRDELMRVTNYREWGPLDRSIDVKIARLRRKIENDPSNPKLIKSVRGVGYVLIVEQSVTDL